VTYNVSAPRFKQSAKCLQAIAWINSISAEYTNWLTLHKGKCRNPQFRSGGFYTEQNEALNPRAHKKRISLLHISLSDFDNRFDSQMLPLTLGSA